MIYLIGGAPRVGKSILGQQVSAKLKVGWISTDLLIEGVDFLPAQVVQLSATYQIRSVFLDCSQMTLDAFDRFPGRSRGYSGLLEGMRRQIVRDVPLWSELIRQEADRFSSPYLDTIDDFPQCLDKAEAILTINSSTNLDRLTNSTR